MKTAAAAFGYLSLASVQALAGAVPWGPVPIPKGIGSPLELRALDVDLHPLPARVDVGISLSIFNGGTNPCAAEVGLPVYADCPLTNVVVLDEGSTNTVAVRIVRSDGARIPAGRPDLRSVSSDAEWMAAMKFDGWTAWPMSLGTGECRRLRVSYAFAPSLEVPSGLTRAPASVQEAAAVRTAACRVRTAEAWAGVVSEARIRVHFGGSVSTGMVRSLFPPWPRLKTDLQWSWDTNVQALAISFSRFEPQGMHDVLLRYQTAEPAREAEVLEEAREKDLLDEEALDYLARLYEPATTRLSLPQGVRDARRARVYEAAVAPFLRQPDRLGPTRVIPADCLPARAWSFLFERYQAEARADAAASIAPPYEKFLRLGAAQARTRAQALRQAQTNMRRQGAGKDAEASFASMAAEADKQAREFQSAREAVLTFMTGRGVKPLPE